MLPFVVAGNIRRLMVRRKMGTTELANRSGLDPSTISRITNSQLIEPKLQTVWAIACVLNVTLDSLCKEK